MTSYIMEPHQHPVWISQSNKNLESIKIICTKKVHITATMDCYNDTGVAVMVQKDLVGCTFLS